MNPNQPPYDPNQPPYDPNQYQQPQQYGYDPNMGYAEAVPVGVPTQQLDAVAKAQRDAAENRSKFAALGMALLVHGLIFAVLAWIVFDVMNDDVPEIIVESAQGESDIPHRQKRIHAKHAAETIRCSRRRHRP